MPYRLPDMNPDHPITGQALIYQDGPTLLRGYLALPTRSAPAPGIVILHQWMGITPHEQQTAHALAELGYAALAADIYGNGVRPADVREARVLSDAYKSDPSLYQRRIRAAVEAFQTRREVDGDRLAVIGFCFGGAGALEAARGGLPVKGVVSFHGGLEFAPARTLRPIDAKVLVCHGADDPFTSEHVLSFQEEMRRAQADWIFISYAGAVHGFTQKAAGNDPSKGSAYHETAARRSWRHMQDFLEELF